MKGSSIGEAIWSWSTDIVVGWQTNGVVRTQDARVLPPQRIHKFKFK